MIITFQATEICHSTRIKLSNYPILFLFLVRTHILGGRSRIQILYYERTTPLSTLVLPSLFFVTWFTKGGGYHPLMNLKLTGPKYDCLVPWYRVGSPLSIDTKIMKIGQLMTSQWGFQTWPDSKSRFSVKIDQNWKKKNNFFAKKVPNIRISPCFFAYKEGKWCF